MDDIKVTYSSEKKEKKRSFIENKLTWLIVAIVIIGGIVGYIKYNNHQAYLATAPGCAHPTIKGNISFTNGDKIYHVPGDRTYKLTYIDTSKGERWFCTVQDAQAAGWRAPRY